MNAFLMVGQSNMSGRGGLKELPDISNPHVRVWRGEGWETAVEPVVRDKPAIAAAGMGPAFGTSVYMMTGEDVGLIPCSLGGSRLREWQPGERLFEAAVAETAKALKSGARLAGILWHQGEANAHAKEQVDAYEGQLREVVLAMKRNIADVPVVMGELGEYLADYGKLPHWAGINGIIRKVAADIPCCASVSSKGLMPNKDNLHFNTPSLREFGRRYYSAWKACAEGAAGR